MSPGKTAVLIILILLVSIVSTACTAPASGAGHENATSAAGPADGTGKAKNVIIMVGDGMGVSTVTAARWYVVQHGNESLYLDSMPYTAVVQTASQDRMVTDSAAGATAIFSGNRTYNGQINYRDGQTFRTILTDARDAGKATGIVTTSRVTDATPAGTYAVVDNRGDESGIALQLLSSGIDVILGGGSSYFLPQNVTDPEYGSPGLRADGRNLIAEFQKKGYVHVWSQAGFDQIEGANATKLLALFEPGSMHYEADRSTDLVGEPDLSEMTATSIRLLSQDPDGYFLMVEGGRIDHAHHENKAGKAILDTVEFDDAVRTAASMINPNETLLLVVSDHSHTLAIAGYPRAGQDVLGTTNYEGRTIPVLSYAVGSKPYVESEWLNLTPDKNTIYPAGIVLNSGIHGGETVIGYAAGPGADRMHGTLHLTDVYHIAHDAMF